MITINQPEDIDWETVQAIAYDNEPVGNVRKVQSHFHGTIAPLHKDRSPGPDEESILRAFGSIEFVELIASL